MSSCINMDPKLPKSEQPLQRNWKRKKAAKKCASPAHISQNAMILPIALSSFLESPSFGFLQEHNGGALSQALGLSLHRELYSPWDHKVRRASLWTLQLAGPPHSSFTRLPGSSPSNLNLSKPCPCLSAYMVATCVAGWMEGYIVATQTCS